jgi:hypothetical protein
MLKFLLLILVIAAVWYGFRYVNKPKPPVAPPAPPPQVKSPPGQAEDLAPCPVCGAYVAPGTAKSCGRADCPYPPAQN